MTNFPRPPRDYDPHDQAQFRMQVAQAVDRDNTKIARVYTVATLPTAPKGAKAYVSDATAPTFLGTLTGGGTVFTPVVFNGTAWIAA